MHRSEFLKQLFFLISCLFVFSQNLQAEESLEDQGSYLYSFEEDTNSFQNCVRKIKEEMLKIPQGYGESVGIDRKRDEMLEQVRSADLVKTNFFTEKEDSRLASLSLEKSYIRGTKTYEISEKLSEKNVENKDAKGHSYLLLRRFFSEESEERILQTFEEEILYDYNQGCTSFRSKIMHINYEKILPESKGEAKKISVKKDGWDFLNNITIKNESLIDGDLVLCPPLTYENFIKVSSRNLNCYDLELEKTINLSLNQKKTS